MELQLKIIGSLLILLGIVHIIFPKYFKWKQELSGISLVSRQIMHIHTLFIALAVFMMGLLCVTSSRELIGTVLGRRILLGLGIFWLIRLLVQFFGYSSLLWKGKRFETIVHICFSSFWLYLTVIFLYGALQ